MAPSPRAELADCSGRRRFAVACSVLSQCVRAETAAAHSRSGVVHAQAQAATPMLLMPGADVVSEETVPTTPAPASAQLTIVYGGRVLVFNDVRADRAADVMRVAARQDMPGGLITDLQVARKASLQRVMEKRRDQLRTCAPYAPARTPPPPATPKEQQEKDANRWLGLGIPG